MIGFQKMGLIAALACGSAVAQPLYVSTEEDFNRIAAGGGFGPYISDGDVLNWTTGTVFMRNRDLLAAFQRPDSCDLGLDGLDVIFDTPTTSRLVAFSTEEAISTGQFRAGDLVATNGAIVPNAALFANWVPPVQRCEYGLDAIQFIGNPSNIKLFLDSTAFQPIPPGQIAARMRNLQIDLWFSTETTCNGGPAAVPLRFLDGDILSVVGGNVVIPQAALMAATALPGIPGLDRGCDGLVAPRNGSIANTYFSTEINNITPLLTDGDIIRIGAGVPTPNYGAISAPFSPPAPFLGLDAMSYFK